jgi:hypothetical protein
MGVYQTGNGKIGSVNYDAAKMGFAELPSPIYQNHTPKGVIEWRGCKCRMANLDILVVDISILKTTAYIITTKTKKQN